MKLLAATTDRGEGLKRAASFVLRNVETFIEALGGESATAISMGGHKMTNPVGETFHSQVPLMYGPYVAKVSLAPASDNIKGLKDAPVDLSGKPDGLRETLSSFFAAEGAAWDLRVQLCTNRETMPVEDATVLWPEAESPHVKVARISVMPQPAYDAQRHARLDEGLAFSPWHGIEAHRPLGSIMRARKPAYEMSSLFRAEANGCPIHQPRSAADLAV